MEKIMRLPQVLQAIGRKKTGLYSMMKNRDFPNSISIGARSRGWLESDVSRWISDRVTATREAE